MQEEQTSFDDSELDGGDSGQEEPDRFDGNELEDGDSDRPVPPQEAEGRSVVAPTLLKDPLSGKHTKRVRTWKKLAGLLLAGCCLGAAAFAGIYWRPSENEPPPVRYPVVIPAKERVRFDSLLIPCENRRFHYIYLCVSMEMPDKRSASALTASAGKPCLLRRVIAALSRRAR